MAYVGYDIVRSVIAVMIILAAIISCSASKTYMVEYDTHDVRYVTDSIVSSGTTIGKWGEWEAMTQDSLMDRASFSTLYDSYGVAKGSIQVRGKGNKIYNIKIIFYGKRK